jgi:hypothetical protein
MPEQLYNKREALNRIYRLLSATVADVPQETPNTVPPPYYSEDEAVSLIAELLAGSLEGETANLPSVVSVASSLVDEATVSAPGTVKLPEYGSIYAHTGSVTMSIGTSYTKVTGTFQNSGLSSDNITPDPDDDRITINGVGTYFVSVNYSLLGTATRQYDFKVYLDSVAQNQLSGRADIDADADEAGGGMSGFVNVTGSNMDLELYAAASAGSSNLRLRAVDVSIFRLET